MQVFAVKNSTRVREGLNEHYRNQYQIVGEGAYLLATKNETTREVATKIGIGDELEDRDVTSGCLSAILSRSAG